MRGGFTSVTFMLILLAAGCVSPEAASEELSAGDTAGDGTTPAAASPSPRPAAAPSAPPPKGASSSSAEAAAVPTAGATTFAWRSNATFGDLAIGARIVPSEETECEITIAMAMADRPGGTGFMAATFSDGELSSMGTSGGGSIASAHVNDITTESLSPGGGNAASRMTFGTTISAAGIEIAAGGVGVGAWENDLTEGGSVLVNVSCDSPIQVLDLSGSHEVALYSLGRSPLGVGAAVSIAGSVGVMDGVALEAASPRVLAAAFGLGFGQMRVTSPEEEVTSSTDPTTPARVFAEGPPGPWWLGVDAMAAPLFGAWGGVLGLAPVGSWDELA